MQVEEQGPGPSVEAEISLSEVGFADFALAGAEGAGEFRCADCGYGVVVQRLLPQCPMCGGTVWESRGAPGPAD